MLFDRAEFIALIISIFSESLLVICWRKFGGRNWRSVVIAATIGTLITHPIFWQVFTTLSSSISYLARLLVLEFIVAIVESLIYRSVTGDRWRTCLLLSFYANAFSCTIGILLSRLQQ
jgi:hypothetical protein